MLRSWYEFVYLSRSLFFPVRLEAVCLRLLLVLTDVASPVQVIYYDRRFFAAFLAAASKCMKSILGVLDYIQRYLTYKKTHPLRTLPQAYARGPRGVPARWAFSSGRGTPGGCYGLVDPSN